MELIDYSIKWLDGEICEGKWTVAFGVLLAVVAAILWKTGDERYQNELRMFQK